MSYFLSDFSLSILYSLGHLHCCKWQSFFLWLSSVYISFIPSSVEGHFSCFLVFVMVSSAAVNIGCRYLFEVLIFPDTYPRVKLL